MVRIFVFLVSSILCSFSFSTELYRYQDANGRWVFGDKKSIGGDGNKGSRNIETVVIHDARVKKVKPELVYENVETEDEEARAQWRLLNPLPVTIQHWLRVKGEDEFFTSELAMPFEDVVITPVEYELPENVKVEHYYLLGEPIKRPVTDSIPPPYSRNKQFLISQGFNGTYSHSGQGNRYAVDIAMPVGEYVLAVKPGVVADGRDDFSIGGATNYFLDKANHVTVMHDDGSYAIYAHILYGSLAVEIGQRIEAGQVLGRIGNTGFSTGPHLHLVIRYNSGRGVFSIPFKFITNKGPRKPKRGEYYSGQLKRVDIAN
jgi:murein DD-endopeptidase MepM/ murein hydrolase activator NlpD